MHGRIKYGVERELASECVPESSISKHIALVYLTIVGTIVPWFAVGIIFEKLAGKETGSEETGIEGGLVFFTTSLDENPGEMLVPNSCGCRSRVFEPGMGAELLVQIQECLRCADI